MERIAGNCMVSGWIPNNKRLYGQIRDFRKLRNVYLGTLFNPYNKYYHHILLTKQQEPWPDNYEHTIKKKETLYNKTGELDYLIAIISETIHRIGKILIEFDSSIIEDGYRLLSITLQPSRAEQTEKIV